MLEIVINGNPVAQIPAGELIKVVVMEQGSAGARGTNLEVHKYENVRIEVEIAAEQP